MPNNTSNPSILEFSRSTWMSLVVPILVPLSLESLFPVTVLADELV